MPGNIDGRGDFKNVYFQNMEKDLAKLENGLKDRVNTTQVMSLGRKFVHQFNMGFDKLVRLIKGHGWISREQAEVKELGKTVKNLTEIHVQLNEAYENGKVSGDAYKKFNEEVLDQLDRMRSICVLARKNLGEKIREKDVGAVETGLSAFITNCENEIEKLDLAAKKKQIVEERKAAKARPKEPVTEPIKGVKNRLEAQLEKKERKDRVVDGLKMELGRMREELPKAKDKDAAERLRRFDEIVAMKEWPINEAGANRLFAEIKDIVFRTYHNANADMPGHITEQLNAFRDILKTKFEGNG